MSLSPSQPLVVHDLDYLKNMSQLMEEHLLEHRFTEPVSGKEGGGERG